MQSFDHAAAADKLSAVWTILGTQNIVKQQRAQAQRAQIGLYCPKVAVMLESWVTDTLPARFEVAAQELAVKFQSGSQFGSASQQASPGPVTLQVHVCCMTVYKLS